MTDAELKALSRALIAECTPATLNTLETALTAGQADPEALGRLGVVVTVAREVADDRAAQAQAAPTLKPDNLGAALEADRKAGRR